MRIAFPTYYDETAALALPFAPTASLTNGSVSLRGAFVDGRIFPPDSASAVYISKISVGPVVTVTLANATGDLGTGTFDPTAQATYIAFTSSSGVYLGLLQGREASLSILSSWSKGVYTFDPAETQLAATVLTPQPQPCIRGFQLDSGVLFSGDVTFVGENGVQVEYLATPDRLRVDIVGDPLFRRRDCNDVETAVTATAALKAILLGETRISPGPTGGVQLLVDCSRGSALPALRITTVDNGLQIGFAHG